MNKLLIGTLFVLMLIISGCNLGASGEAEEELPTQIPATGRPSLTIVSPASGDEFVVDEQIFVRITAIDSAGVTRAQLFANDEIVKTISSESLAGNTTFEGVLDYTPRTTGEVDLRVLAFRGSVASDPQAVTVIVREESDDVQVTSRPDTGSGTGSTTGSGTGSTGGNTGQPVIPNDGVCRALTNVGLNFRSEPTTSRENVISVLQSGTLAPIIARLGDNSWWKLSYNNRVGWVSAEFTTIYGNCSNVPIESVVVNTPVPTFTRPPTITPLPTLTHTPRPSATPGRPDLIITSIVGAENVTIPSGESEVTEEYTVTISNLGFGRSGQFDVVIRVNDVEYDLGVVSNLNNNESIVLSQDVTFDSAGFYTIRAEADPGNEIEEISEVNNRGDLEVDVTAE